MAEHSIPSTLERVNYEPTLWLGLTGQEIMYIGLFNLVFFSIIGVILGFVLGSAILGGGAGALFGVFMLGVMGRRIAKIKEAKPPELFWVDVILKISIKFNMKSSIFHKKETWSLERNNK